MMYSPRYSLTSVLGLTVCMTLPAFSVLAQNAAISPARAGSTDILSCPFETLRTAYLSLYEETDALNVAALESEVFKVCIERQKQVKQLLDNEERLRAELGDMAPSARTTSTVQARISAPAPGAGIAEEERDVSEITTLAAEPTTPAPSPPTQPADFREIRSAELARPAQGQCSDRYTSGTIFGAATLEGGLHAFVFDATRGTRLTVKAGDALPGGLTIQRISTEAGVVVSEQGVERPLARTLTEPAFDDGGGLLFKTVTLADIYKLDDAQDSSRDGDWEALE